MNRIVLIGRLTKDPELRYTQSGVGVASFTLAVDRQFKGKDGQKETDFINIVAWRGLGENCANYLAKGKLAGVDGRLQIRNYETKDGQKRTIAEVVADDVQFLSPKSDSANNAPTQREPGEDVDNAAEDVFGEVAVGDEDLPF